MTPKEQVARRFMNLLAGQHLSRRRLINPPPTADMIFLEIAVTNNVLHTSPTKSYDPLAGAVRELAEKIKEKRMYRFVDFTAWAHETEVIAITDLNRGLSIRMYEQLDSNLRFSVYCGPIDLYEFEALGRTPPPYYEDLT